MDKILEAILGQRDTLGISEGSEGSQRGEAIAKKILWRLCVDTTEVPVNDEDRAKTVEALRRAADLLESKSPTLVGLVFTLGTRTDVPGEQHTRVDAEYHVLAPTPMFAANFLELEMQGRQAVKESLPTLLKVAMTEDLTKYV